MSKSFPAISRLKPNKLMGQNWLVNPKILGDILKAGEIEGGETVLEVGPGTGLLTEQLVRQGAKIIAVEKDQRLIPILREKLKPWQHVKIVKEDILKFNPRDYGLKDKNYKLIGNVPYYLTSYLLRTVFEKWPQPQIMVLMIQKEVAQRITARPPRMNLLALFAQYFAQLEIIKIVSRKNFKPIPKVDSAIIRLTPHSQTFNTRKELILFRLWKAGFSSKRKKLIGNLVKRLTIERKVLEKAFLASELDLNCRAENLSLAQWQILNSQLRSLF